MPYGGAAKLIYPIVRNFGRGGAPTRLLTLADAVKLREQGVDPSAELFSLVLHRSNLPLSWSHISLQRANEWKLKRELERRRLAAAETGNQNEYVGFLEKYVADLEEETKQRSGALEVLEKLAAAQEDRERGLTFDVESLKHRLAEAGKGGRERGDRPENVDLIAATVLAAIEKEPTPEQSLLLIEHLYPDRVVILPDAWQSARDAESFKHRRQLYELLHILVTEYWTALATGRSDGEARKPFGNSFAPTESETVAGNNGARARRTFNYGGQQVEMMTHLKIGRKPSVAETIRVHFEWFADDQCIVIGHCGEHIRFK